MHGYTTYTSENNCSQYIGVGKSFDSFVHHVVHGCTFSGDTVDQFEWQQDQVCFMSVKL